MAELSLKHLRDAAEQLWPVATAEDWDRVGLVSGHNDVPVRRVLLAVDAVRDTVDEAISVGADALLTHHPLLLRGVHTVAEDTAKGQLLADLIRANCALFSAHTNADQPEGGVSAVLAERLGLHGAVPIVAAEGPTEPFGLGRVGELDDAVSLQEFASLVAEILPPTVSGVRAAGDPRRRVKRVAVLGGAGDSLLNHPLVRSADVYVTSDLRHHPAQEAIELAHADGGPALIDVAHWASESVWLENAAQLLSQLLPSVEFKVSTLRTDPWTFALGAER